MWDFIGCLGDINFYQTFISIEFQLEKYIIQKMGCGIFPQQKPLPPIALQPLRQYTKSKKIDCRKKSTHALDYIHQNITVISQKLNEEYIQFVCKYLKQHSLFCTLEDKQLKEIANSMELATAQKDTYIINEGDTGTCFFMIKRGCVDVEIQNKFVRTLGQGECFGELALIYCMKRTAAIKCKSENIELILIKAKEFKQVMRKIREKNNERTKTLIQNVQIFSLLTTKQKYTLLYSLVRENFKKGTVLFHKNDIPVSFYIIQSGKVSLAFNDPNKKDILLGQKQSFGESVFKLNAKREGTATVVEDTVCLSINQAKMKECLGGTLANVVYHNIKKWALKSSPLFQNYDNREIDQIALHFSTKFAKANTIIMDIQKPVDSLVICIEGKINSKPVGTLFNDQYYENPGHLDEDLIKNDNGVYAELTFIKLKETLEHLNRKGSAAVIKKRQSIVFKQNNQVLNMNNLDYLVKLGEGQFGQVHLVKDRRSGNLFALKCLQKEKIKKQAMEDSAISQRQILASVCHPLIVGFYAAYQDKKNVYYLMQYIYGIEMFQAIRQIGILNKILTRFYLGSIILAIEYLHSKNIIYRDIKPENSIVNYQGKVFLIDLGTAKILKSENGYRTDTIIGTPHYMAPEVMQGKGYSLQADYWSLGVLFYELICGRLPYGEKVNNPYKVYEEVMRTQLTFPEFVKDQQAIGLIKKLLNKNIQQRGLGGFNGIKDAPYFQGFSWQDLYQGHIVPPFIPRKFRVGGSGSVSAKYKEMQGYPLVEYLHSHSSNKRQKQRKSSQQFQLWTNNIIE